MSRVSRHRGRRSSTAGLVATAGLVLLMGCSGLQARSCTDMGASSGIVFDFTEVVEAHRGERLHVEPV